MSDALRRTPLHEEHVRLEARMVPFAGWSMPIQYPTGIQAEHRSVREAAGLFDVSHMGEFEISGRDALQLLQEVTVNDASRLEVGQAQYSALCREDGGVLDDLLVYRTGEEGYLVVVNAANRETDLEWIWRHSRGMDLELVDRSDETALLALQGPAAPRVLQPLTSIDLDEVTYYRFARGAVAGVPALVARTGYTGEDGFELYVGSGDAVRVWRALLRAEEAPLPAGLGARDSLRLEVGYALHGQDVDVHHTPLEAGLGWIVKLDKESFIGREALLRQKEEGVERRLAGIRLEGRAFPRPGYPIVADGREVGTLTSGTVSPTLGVGIALGYLPSALAAPGTRVAVRIRERDVPGVVERPPFYRDGSIRR